MVIPGNTWQMVWEAAKPVPARRQVCRWGFLHRIVAENLFLFCYLHVQKRLFDDTKEAEKVIHFLESQTIGQIAQLSVAALYHTAIGTIKVCVLELPRDNKLYALNEFVPRRDKMRLNLG